LFFIKPKATKVFYIQECATILLEVGTR